MKFTAFSIKSANQQTSNQRAIKYHTVPPLHQLTTVASAHRCHQRRSSLPALPPSPNPTGATNVAAATGDSSSIASEIDGSLFEASPLRLELITSCPLISDICLKFPPSIMLKTLNFCT
ncbi:hypothetical protein L1887_18374 [Cichorium endivia]|nr:hypothetical protein L1887_18374 [Cichorium endivia]